MTPPLSPEQFLPVALIVDSDADSAEMYATALSLDGFTTVEAHDADQVWQWVLEEPPTVVITELKLREANDGIDFIRRLRQAERTRAVPIVVVTLSADRQYLEAARLAGCDLVLCKPCSPDELSSQVLSLLARPDAA
jgi:DNA-binding response OmpR family regulator